MRLITIANQDNRLPSMASIQFINSLHCTGAQIDKRLTTRIRYVSGCLYQLSTALASAAAHSSGVNPCHSP